MGHDSKQDVWEEKLVERKDAKTGKNCHAVLRGQRLRGLSCEGTETRPKVRKPSRSRGLWYEWPDACDFRPEKIILVRDTRKSLVETREGGG